MRTFLLIVLLAYGIPLLLLFASSVKADDCNTDTECEQMWQHAYTVKHHS